MNDKAIITEAANRYGIPAPVLWGLYGTETGFGKNVTTSSAGAVGPFQFEPATAKGMGVNPYDFKSAAFGAARYLSQYKGRGIAGMLSAYNAGPAGGLQQGYVNTTLSNAKSYGPAAGTTIRAMSPPAVAPKALPGVSEGFDQAGFQKAERAAVLGKLLTSEGNTKDNPLLATGLATTKLPLRSEYVGEAKTPEQHVLSAEGHSKFVPAGSDVTKLKGIVDFDGKKVAAWIAPILKYAQAHGVTPELESGYRSKAEQERIYNSGVRPAAVPGTSNHEGDAFPRGAVDLKNAQAVAKVLEHSPYAKTLVYAGAKDPVHFSHPHNGGY